MSNFSLIIEFCVPETLLTNQITMCVIIIKQKGQHLPKEVAKNSARINPHGLGIIWLDTFEVTYHKSSEYKKLDTDRPFICHFRYATVGAINKENTHPFRCGKNQNEWLMMNGTIRGLGDIKKSDSRVLAEAIGEMPRHTWKKELAKYDSRFVTINTRNKTFQVYNKNLWTIKDGVWYSKDNVIEDNVIAVYGTLKKGYSNYWHYLSSSNYIGKGKTLNKYPLLIKGLPYLIDEVDKGHNVEVDVFGVSDARLKELDRLEGHPNWYCRRQIPIKVNNRTITCWVYFNLRERVTDDSVLHKKYTQDYKPFKKWWDYDLPEKQEKPKPEPKPIQRSFYFEDVLTCEDCDNYPREVVDTNEFDIENEKPICIDCFHDLEHDAFGNYHCCGCDGWFTEAEVLRFKP